MLIFFILFREFEKENLKLALTEMRRVLKSKRCEDLMLVLKPEWVNAVKSFGYYHNDPFSNRIRDKFNVNVPPGYEFVCIQSTEIKRDSREPWLVTTNYRTFKFSEKVRAEME